MLSVGEERRKQLLKVQIGVQLRNMILTWRSVLVFKGLPPWREVSRLFAGSKVAQGQFIVLSWRRLAGDQRASWLDKHVSAVLMFQGLWNLNIWRDDMIRFPRYCYSLFTSRWDLSSWPRSSNIQPGRLWGVERLMWTEWRRFVGASCSLMGVSHVYADINPEGSQVPHKCLLLTVVVQLISERQRGSEDWTEAVWAQPSDLPLVNVSTAPI